MLFQPPKLDKNISVYRQNTIFGTKRMSLVRKLVVGLCIASEVLSIGYVGISFLVATQLAYEQPLPITKTPANLGLSYRDVSFLSREDHLLLKGWFIPGVLPNGQLTATRTIIMVHGMHANRASSRDGLLDLSAALARRGFAILAFDLRGNGQSTPAPLSFGYFEQRDVLGAVDFLRSGELPYPELGRPRSIGGWGLSMGAVSLLLAAAHESAIRAVVADCAFAAFVPLLEKDPVIPAVFIPSVAGATRLLYGVDFYAIRPVDVVANIAPRPIFFIQGSADTLVPPWNMPLLSTAASEALDAHVQTWLVHGARHSQSYHVMGTEYVNRVGAFFTAALGPAA